MSDESDTAGRPPSRSWVVVALAGVLLIGLTTWPSVGFLTVPLVGGILAAMWYLPLPYALSTAVVVAVVAVGNDASSVQAVGVTLGLATLVGAASLREGTFDGRTVAGYLALTAGVCVAVVVALAAASFEAVAFGTTLGLALAAYGLHRYELVALDLLPDS
ncbi:hypothetical protein C453_16858 [Haloferax elongans ATCC BAA-1513]|uniref:DUF8163 domain-containing protein n=1 Tax=Haloferax elongans ATCC BAA-1513 TaxID=1230453 RepID=M0HE46_HALEO|nr:hypothetical protein [Haloferax elongans]ELZ82775.1 hypothetical protein C453_16858 [Haloferax elongans ATCC BAA-1513]